MKSVVLALVVALCIALTGCNSNKVEKIEIDKGPMEVVRTEDSLYKEAGENPFQSGFKEQAERNLEILDKGMAKSRLQIEDLKEGTGEGVKDGDTVKVNYRGTLTSGEEFDSSYERDEPFSFTVGKGSVIKGWEEGILGMKAGGKRKLTVPADMAYGDRELPGIPANSTLVFEIELLSIE